jgi:hypothetical protein
LGFIKIYNRNLSESEIKQNFEATRGRYGIWVYLQDLK